MVNLGKVIGIVTFMIVVIIQLFILNFYTYVYSGITQFHTMFSAQPSFKYYISQDDIIVCISNNENFSIYVYNISGKYIYLPKTEIIPQLSTKNISLIIINTTAFNNAVKAANCVLTIKIGFLDSNITTTQVI